MRREQGFLLIYSAPYYLKQKTPYTRIRVLVTYDITIH